MKYYKLCTESNGKLWSWTKGCIADAAIEYKVGKFVYPKIDGSRLFVFDDICAAKKMSSAKLFECEVKNPTKFGIILNDTGCRLANRLLRICILRKKHKKYTHLLRYHEKNKILHKNIFMCDAVKLIKEI